MDQLTNHKTDLLLSDNTSLDLPQQTTIKPNRKPKMTILCSECNQIRKRSNENHQICQVCYKAKSVYIPSGNKVIDDFIKHTLISGNKLAGKMVFVPYDQFKNVEFIAEGGFSKIYKATWIDGPIMHEWNNVKNKYKNYKVVLKKLNNSKGITSKELNELKIFHEFSLNWKMTGSNRNNVSRYFGITQDPVTKDIMIVMPHYKLGDLTNYITNNFYSIEWVSKLYKLSQIVTGLINIHSVNILHRDFHSGNIFFRDKYNTQSVYLGDLGLSKSATEITDDDNNKENYECWHSDPNKRPVATDIFDRLDKMWKGELVPAEKTKIIQSLDIGPVTKNNPGAIYRSRSLSGMIQSAMFTMSTRSLRSQSITAEFDKRKFDATQIENSFNDEDKFIKKVKLIENENNDYTTQEFELDIDIDSEQFIDDKRYTTLENDFDI
ncbi:kinase-like domain-containing protein [Rhizophagus irregularis DAOM 181602=DAOM 197198]|nr:kinase-like domain-containing protein [Rhizophagus irregularis DAOM 181602=DAOM 197198]